LARTDYECFTLLRPTAPGLEMLNGAGEWIDVRPVPGTFVVNIGDMLELWTNGAYVAPRHRVCKVKGERYSFPLFFNVDYHTEVKPLPQFASRDGK
jgi:isopenicillin N synthase-like dioxygenase